VLGDASGRQQGRSGDGHRLFIQSQPPVAAEPPIPKEIPTRPDPFGDAPVPARRLLRQRLLASPRRDPVWDDPPAQQGWKDSGETG